MAAGAAQERSGGTHKVVMFGLTTCGWCKKMRTFLEDERVAFELTYVDDLEGAERDAAIEEMKRWNPALSFPTVVVDDSKTIVGYRPDDVKEALGL